MARVCTRPVERHDYWHEREKLNVAKELVSSVCDHSNIHRHQPLSSTEPNECVGLRRRRVQEVIRSFSGRVTMRSGHSAQPARSSPCVKFTFD